MGSSPTHSFEIITDERVLRMRKIAERLAKRDKTPKQKKYNLWEVPNAGRALHLFFKDEREYQERYAKEIRQKKKRPPAPNGRITAVVRNICTCPHVFFIRYQYLDSQIMYRVSAFHAQPSMT